MKGAVLITGASSGIGRQLAMDYAASGHSVYACGRDVSRLESLVEQGAGLIQPLIFDVTDIESTEQALASLEPLPQILILNAGTCEYIDNGQIDTELFRRVFEANLFGPLHCIQAMQSRFGPDTQLVLMGSSAAYLPFPRAEAYGASKAALAYLAQTLAVDLAPMSVTLVSPGFVKTPLTDRNDFAMPMRVSPQYASRAIRRGLAQRKSEIHFPLRFTWLLKTLSRLPLGIKRRLMIQLKRTPA